MAATVPATTAAAAPVAAQPPAAAAAAVPAAPQQVNVVQRGPQNLMQLAQRVYNVFNYDKFDPVDGALQWCQDGFCFSSCVSAGAAVGAVAGAAGGGAMTFGTGAPVGLVCGAVGGGIIGAGAGHKMVEKLHDLRAEGWKGTELDKIMHAFKDYAMTVPILTQQETGVGVCTQTILMIDKMLGRPQLSREERLHLHAFRHYMIDTKEHQFKKEEGDLIDQRKKDRISRKEFFSQLSQLNNEYGEKDVDRYIELAFKETR